MNMRRKVRKRSWLSRSIADASEVQPEANRSLRSGRRSQMPIKDANPSGMVREGDVDAMVLRPLLRWHCLEAFNGIQACGHVAAGSKATGNIAGLSLNRSHFCSSHFVRILITASIRKGTCGKR